MTVQEVFDLLNGVGVDYDHAFGDQCVDWAQILNRLYKAPTLTGAVAADIWNTYPKDFYDRISNSADNFPQKGDIVIWEASLNGGAGHIAVARDGSDSKTLKTYDQNWNGMFVQPIDHNYSHVLGWLRPKQLPQDSGTITDELRKARDDNWNKYQAEVSVNNDLTKQLQDEQKKNQDLRDILDKQTTADANLGNQVLDAEHARDDVIASRKRILDKLGVSTTDEAIQTITALQQPHEELVKNVVPVMDELASAAIFKRSKKATSWLQKIRDFLHL